ncbi:hypothetical protein GO730_39150 [Spirosoma sp. HMF3257]|uniref:histidine kinase n=1 Tax=Spirosoma telluris TaxID=2183553 RepID=A0A327NCE4_9BACT|nr:hypothetical protein [Spirosoma telluris]RAI72910.1 hypothetical protein HMF3257_39080 [Spirosoma telluris]
MFLQKSFIENFVISGIAHNTKNSVESALLRLKHFTDEFEKIELDLRKREKPLHVEVKLILEKLNLLKAPLEDIDKTNARLREFQKEKEIRFTDISLQDFIQDVYKLCEPKAKAEYIDVIVVNNIDKKVWIDINYMEQAVINLFINSVESIVDSKNKKGRIRVETKYDKRSNIIYINVSDNGRGIDEKIKKMIFLPYFTTKSYGTGIGLPSTKFIVDDLHNGKIDFFVERDDTLWTTFSISLPLTVR